MGGLSGGWDGIGWDEGNRMKRMGWRGGDGMEGGCRVGEGSVMGWLVRSRREEFEARRRGAG